MRGSPLIFGIALLSVGWASGGGAAQILFSLFGELVFNRGPAGIGLLWASAGLGLLLGGTFAHWLGQRISFSSYKRTIGICYVIHGGSYVVFSQMPYFWLAAFFLAISRAAIAVSSVLNMSQLLRHIPDAFRGRVFATIETMNWSMMMLSMMGAGIASTAWSPRTIGAISGVLSSSTAFFWLWANWSGRLPEPERPGLEPEEVGVHGDPVV
jgi:MFS family permease